MTRKDAFELSEAMTAYGCGKNVQWKSRVSEDWHDVDDPTFSTHFQWRIKPEPKTRPWNCPDDVPSPVCWIRSSRGSISASGDISNEPDSMHAMVVTASTAGISYISRGIVFVPWWDEKIKHWEYSTDRKNWFPCTVTEEAQ